jgi:hypothetical protein
MKYLVVIEQTQTGFSACSPDLPGCDFQRPFFQRAPQHRGISSGLRARGDHNTDMRWCLAGLVIVVLQGCGGHESRTTGDEGVILAALPDAAEPEHFFSTCDEGGPQGCDARVIGELCASWPGGLLSDGESRTSEGACSLACQSDQDCPRIPGERVQCVAFDDGFNGCWKMCSGDAGCSVGEMK